MKSRQILIAIVILFIECNAAAAQSKKKMDAEAPPPESILAGATPRHKIRPPRFRSKLAGRREF
jgi:hypothetical protein